MKIFKCREVKTPVRGTNLSAGIDFFIPKYFKETVLKPHEDILIPSGIIANFASNLMLMAAEKSGVTSSATAKTLYHQKKLLKVYLILQQYSEQKL